MLKVTAATGLALTALAGCDGGGGAERNTRTVAPASAYVEQLKGLSEDNRGLALRRAVQDSKQRCKRVESSGYQQDYKNMSVWTLRCTDGEYALFIAPNGDVQVRSCADAAKLGLLQCRFPEASEASS
jgi:hypothetical protein